MLLLNCLFRSSVENDLKRDVSLQLRERDAEPNSQLPRTGANAVYRRASIGYGVTRLSGCLLLLGLSIYSDISQKEQSQIHLSIVYVRMSLLNRTLLGLKQSFNRRIPFFWLSSPRRPQHPGGQLPPST
jgi:hypothetical protein